MINYLKNKLRKRKIKNTFSTYGHEVKHFELEELGKVSYAQWLHPFEQPKEITNAHIQFYKQLTKEGGMIIDIGAHTGDTTVPMALAVGKEGLVLGLEPNPHVFKILEKNASLNPLLTNIVPLCFAATETDGQFTFNYSDASFCNGGFLSQIDNENHKHNYTLQVTGKNLEKFLHKQFSKELDKLCLIKVDAEGYDKEILKTIKIILTRYRPALMIECYKRLNKEEREELFDVVTSLDYRLYKLNNFESLEQLQVLGRNNMSDHQHFEMLALHRDKLDVYNFVK